MERADRSWCHPSFLPVLERIAERGYLSPHAYVEYTCQDGTGHTHQVILGDGKMFSVIADGESLEDVASELAEAVQGCERKDRVDQHGRSHWAQHSTEEAKNAYYAGLAQLTTREYDREAAHLTWLIRMHKLWRGPMPAAVLTPSLQEPRQTQLMVPNANGVPRLYNVPEGRVELPDPRQVGAIKKSYGWDVDRRRKAMRRLR